MLRWLDEEEERLMQIAAEENFILDQQATIPQAEGAKRERILTYDEYYGIAEDITKGKFASKRQVDSGKISFE